MKNFTFLLFLIGTFNCFGFIVLTPTGGGSGSNSYVAGDGIDISGTIISATGPTAAQVAQQIGSSNLVGVFSANKTLWVDPINGSDVTGTRGRIDKPFKTIGYWQTDQHIGEEGYLDYWPTGALLNAQGGDLIKLSAGRHTNIFCALWKTNQGINLIGEGVGVTYLVEAGTLATSSQAVNGGSIVSFGNGSIVGDFSYESSDPGGSFGPLTGIGDVGSGYFSYTNIYTGFTNGLLFNVNGCISNANYDCLYWGAETPAACSLVVKNCHFYNYYDGYANYNGIGAGFTQPYIELWDCVFSGAYQISIGVRTTNLASVECITSSSSTKTGTNIFHNCVFETYANPGAANSHGVFIVQNLGSSNLWMFDNCTYKNLGTNSESFRNNSNTNVVILGGNASITSDTGATPPQGYWYDPIQQKLIVGGGAVLSGSVTVTNSATVRNITISGSTNVAPAGYNVAVTAPVRWLSITNAGNVYLVPAFAP